eukprot:79360_1
MKSEKDVLEWSVDIFFSCYYTHHQSCSVNMSLSVSWDRFIENPFIESLIADTSGASLSLNEKRLNELLARSMKEILLSEEQFESHQESYETSKAETQKLKDEKKQLQDCGGRTQRSIQQETRLRQVHQEIKSSKMRYKRQGNKMRRTQRISSALMDKLDRLLSQLNVDPHKKNESLRHVHFRLISFCISTLRQIQQQLAPNHRNIQHIYEYLSAQKQQTATLLSCLLKWIHSYSNWHDPSHIIEAFNGDDDLWILYMICCAFPALFLPISIGVLKGKPCLCLLLHHLLAKFPIISLKMIHSYAQSNDVDTLQMILEIAQFHPKLWHQIQCQTFCEKVFDLLVSSLNTNDDNVIQLLFGFEHLMIHKKSISSSFATHLSDIVIELDDVDQYISHNLSIKYANNATQRNGSIMLSLCNRFSRLKHCDFGALIGHRSIMRCLCLTDHAFWLNAVVELIVEYEDMGAHFSLLIESHRARITNDIDTIVYYVFKKSSGSRKAMRNLCFVCATMKLTFNVNMSLVSQMHDTLRHNVSADVLHVLQFMALPKLPKNIGIILSRYLLHSLIQSAAAENSKNRNITMQLILKLCECDARISKESIELCVSHIICPELNGDKISTLKASSTPTKAAHKKILRPKIRINPYANALLKQIDSQHNVQMLKKLIENKTTTRVCEQQQQEKKRRDGASDVCWYLLSKLSAHYVPYLSNFVVCILPGIHLSPSQSRYAESVQKGTVLMFDHDVLILFESYPDLWLILKLFCSKTKGHQHAMLTYLRSLCVSYYIKCKVNRDYDTAFYSTCNVLFECLYLMRKISFAFYKMSGLISELKHKEIAKLLRHICNLCLMQSQPQQLANIIISKASPSFPLQLTQKMLDAEKRIIRQIFLQNTELMTKHTNFVASVLSM